MQTLYKHFHSPSLGLFIIRLVAGVIFIFHGVGKLSDMEGTIAFFASLGFGAFFAWLVAIVETLGGIALIVGYFSKFFAALLAIVMIVAIIKVKASLGFQAAEIDMMLLATLIAVLFAGCGRYSICGWLHKNCTTCNDKHCGCSCH